MVKSIFLYVALFVACVSALPTNGPIVPCTLDRVESACKQLDDIVAAVPESRVASACPAYYQLVKAREADKPRCDLLRKVGANMPIECQSDDPIQNPYAVFLHPSKKPLHFNNVCEAAAKLSQLLKEGQLHAF
ncbi:hypothetical protein A0J61_10585 [Choanephora cucurbitarum]|uniref:Secreted protein n=1 Tax=Choanephora cucurbitarum TaxID=101091 RepID=A0A1C7MY88_9FUNG|nr:hypothetical protein A0J61_10585 [Choanephora cucurbitarum]